MRNLMKGGIDQLMEMMASQRGATFSGVKYQVNESSSRTDKNYPLFDGKRHKLQKIVEVAATLNSVYQNKVTRVFADNGIDFKPTPHKMTGRSYADFDKNRCIVFKDGMPQTAENAYLCFVVEAHAKPTAQLFHLGQPVEREDVWNAEFITPSGLNRNARAAVKNSMYNHAISMAANAEQEGNTEEAERLRNVAEFIAKNEQLEKLGFVFRTVKLANIISVNFDGMTFIVEN